MPENRISRPEAGIAAAPQTLRYSRIVSLSQPLHPAMPQWPGDPPLEWQTVADWETEGYFLRRFTMGEHSGTHANAPAAFHPGGVGIDAYPPESLIAPAVVIEVRAAAAANPDYTLTLADLRAWERRQGIIPAGSVVLLFTGWADKWDDPAAYLGLTADPGMESDGLHFPGFGLEAAQWLLRERDIAGLGIDTAGVDSGQDSGFAVNRLLLEKPRLVLENLGNLQRLPPFGATLMVGVLPLTGGSGSPAAVLAFLP